ncbi:unnamed protein product [Lupinus luteus]|uniref:Secreted protein n=1 Tax=Lupinus luteus TaxID=3873 RepID=A0AAV1WKZ3_LUPLU
MNMLGILPEYMLCTFGMPAFWTLLDADDACCTWVGELHAYLESWIPSSMDSFESCISVCDFGYGHSLPLCSRPSNSYSCHGWYWSWCNSRRVDSRRKGFRKCT